MDRTQLLHPSMGEEVLVLAMILTLAEAVVALVLASVLML